MLFTPLTQIEVTESRRQWKPKSLGFVLNTVSMNVAYNVATVSIVFYRLGRRGKFRLLGRDTLIPLFDFEKVFKDDILIELFKLKHKLGYINRHRGDFSKHEFIYDTKIEPRPLPMDILKFDPMEFIAYGYALSKYLSDITNRYNFNRLPSVLNKRQVLDTFSEILVARSENRKIEIILNIISYYEAKFFSALKIALDNNIRYQLIFLKWFRDPQHKMDAFYHLMKQKAILDNTIVSNYTDIHNEYYNSITSIIRSMHQIILKKDEIVKKLDRYKGTPLFNTDRKDNVLNIYNLLKNKSNTNLLDKTDRKLLKILETEKNINKLLRDTLYAENGSKSINLNIWHRVHKQIARSDLKATKKKLSKIFKKASQKRLMPTYNRLFDDDQWFEGSIDEIPNPIEANAVESGESPIREFDSPEPPLPRECAPANIQSNIYYVDNNYEVNYAYTMTIINNRIRLYFAPPGDNRRIDTIYDITRILYQQSPEQTLDIAFTFLTVLPSTGRFKFEKRNDEMYYMVIRNEYTTYDIRIIDFLLHNLLDTVIFKYTCDHNIQISINIPKYPEEQRLAKLSLRIEIPERFFQNR